MPYPRHFTWQRWKECSRCGFHFPIKELHKDSYSIDVCSDCFDPDGYDEERRKIEFRLEEFKDDESNDGFEL